MKEVRTAVHAKVLTIMFISKPTVADVLLCAAILAYGQPVAAQSMYRYVDANGKVHYTDRPPAENAGRPADKLSRQGIVTQHIPAAVTPEERAVAEQAKKKKAEDEAIAKIEQRRIQAILSAYSSERELENARSGALNPVLEAIQQAENAIANLNKRLSDLKPEIEALGGKPMPGALRTRIKNIENESNAVEQLLEAKRAEERSINARFEEDRRRYAEGMREIAERKAKQEAFVRNATGATAK